MKLGLYGGSFNPIHRCHLVVAEAARSRLGLDTILFIPAGDPPHKSSSEFIAAQHRLEMIKLAIAPFPYFELSDIETRRSNKSYSIDTILELQRDYPADTALVFIIGLDAFLEVPTWKDPEGLLSSCDFAVVSRPGSALLSLNDFPFLEGRNESVLMQMDEGRIDFAHFPLKTGRTLWAIRIPPCEVSAIDIRRRLRNHQELENSLSPPVESYIRQLDL
jgi:nicotinate-nucleotide adenylyltransferase